MDTVTIAVLIAFLAAAGIIIWLVLRKPKAATVAAAAPAAPLRTLEYKSGLKIEVLEEGSSGDAKWGNQVSVHYDGWLTDGTKFDSSRDRGSPFTFKLGAGKVIMGWDEGLKGMRIGEKRKLTIPPKLGYGNRPTGRIPAGSTLIFEIELLGIR
jgi:FKBP-type peptidyl-prolyl cis-trans isomerase